jgi:hypothetical protein
MRKKMINTINVRPVADLPKVGEFFRTSDSKVFGQVEIVDTYAPFMEADNMFRICIKVDAPLGSKPQYRWTTLVLDRAALLSDTTV